jgi:hypothetical protein
LRALDDEQASLLIDVTAAGTQKLTAKEMPAPMPTMSEGRLPNKLEESVVSRWQVLSGVNKEVK